MYNPVTDHIAMLPTGVLLVKLKGSVGFFNAGDYENCSFEMQSESTDIYSPQFGIRRKIGKIRTEKTGSIAFELNQMPMPMRSVAMQSKKGLVLNQAAVTAKEFEIVDLEAGYMFPIGYRNITALDIEGYEQGVHYALDPAAGMLEIIKHPSDAPKGTVSGTVSAASMVGTNAYAIMSDMDIRGEAKFRSLNDYGPRFLYEFWDIELSAPGARTMGTNSADPASMTYEGEIYPSVAQSLLLGDDWAYGRVSEI